MRQLFRIHCVMGYLTLQLLHFMKKSAISIFPSQCILTAHTLLPGEWSHSVAFVVAGA